MNWGSEEGDDAGVDLSKFDEMPKLIPPLSPKLLSDLDNPGVDLDLLSVKSIHIEPSIIEESIKSLKENLKNSVNSEAGVDIDLFRKIEEEKYATLLKLQQEEFKKQKLISDQKRELLDLIKKDLEFASKRTDECSSVELNERTEEELSAKKEDDTIAEANRKFIFGEPRFSKESVEYWLKIFQDTLG